MSDETKTPMGSMWYPLFAHMHDEHGIILTDGELSDVASVAAEVLHNIGPFEAIQLERELAAANERIAELERDLRSREEGGEWVSRCDHEDELAELRELADNTKAVCDERDEAYERITKLEELVRARGKGDE